MQETTAIDTPVNLVAFVDEFPGVPVDVLLELIDNHDGYQPDEIMYEGEADSFADLAFQILEATGQIEDVPEWLRNHIDYNSIGRDFDCGGMYEIRHNFTGYYWTIL